MKVDLTVIRDSEAGEVPSDRDFRSWVKAALGEGDERFSLSIRIVGEARSSSLNRRYRDREGPANVLSFRSEVPPALHPALGHRPLGDLVICAPLVAREAAAQGKPARHHWAHLTVHGVLHLLGHDHHRSRDAAHMEQLEREALSTCAIPDPYAEC